MKKLILLILLIFPLVASAHQPRITRSTYTQIENPQVSQAFYGDLKGAKDVYEINSDKPFRLYIGILVPDIDGIEKDVSAEIYYVDDNTEVIMARLDGTKHVWTKFYEEYAGDNYFLGPEFKGENSTITSLRGREENAGKYLIKVYSQDNLGKYVLTVGEEEIFRSKDIINATKLLPELKTSFWGKSVLSIFSGRSGLYLLIPLGILLIFVFASVFITVKLSREKFRR